MNKRILYVSILVLSFCFFRPISIAQNKNGRAVKNTPVYHSPGGTYSDWYFPKDESYSSLEWTLVPVADPPASVAKEGLLHYYAYNFALVNSSKSIGRGYAGFQTNGIFKGSHKGKVINFSIWGSNAGKTSGLLNTGNEESGGVQIMYKYDWEIGHNYRFELKQGPGGIDSLGKWWGLWITDQYTGTKDFLGEQRVPSVIDGEIADKWEPHTSMFGEDLHWWNSLNGRIKYKDCSAFQGSAMAAIDITANGGIAKPIKFTNRTNSGQPVTSDRGFKTVNCDVSIYEDSTHFNVQHNLGYWASPAPDYLNKK